MYFETHQFYIIKENESALEYLEENKEKIFNPIGRVCVNLLRRSIQLRVERPGATNERIYIKEDMHKGKLLIGYILENAEDIKLLIDAPDWNAENRYCFKDFLKFPEKVKELYKTYIRSYLVRYYYKFANGRGGAYSCFEYSSWREGRMQMLMEYVPLLSISHFALRGNDDGIKELNALIPSLFKNKETYELWAVGYHRFLRSLDLTFRNINTGTMINVRSDYYPSLWEKFWGMQYSPTEIAKCLLRDEGGTTEEEFKKDAGMSVLEYATIILDKEKLAQLQKEDGEKYARIFGDIHDLA